MDDRPVSTAPIHNIPAGTYVTYTLLTPPERSFPDDQFITISDICNSDFKRSMHSPWSGEHSHNYAIDVVSFAKADDSPVFLIKYAGK